MKFLERFLGSKKEDALATIPAQNAVIVKGKKHFDIYQDGNGFYRAQHKDGYWMDGDFDTPTLRLHYEDAKQYEKLEECQDDCMYYIQSQMMTKVGTIEFIPAKK